TPTSKRPGTTCPTTTNAFGGCGDSTFCRRPAASAPVNCSCGRSCSRATVSRSRSAPAASADPRRSARSEAGARPRLGLWHLPVGGHPAEVEERRLVARLDRVLDLVVEPLAGLLGERDRHRGIAEVVDGRALAVLGEARLTGVTGVVAAGEHLLEDAEPVVAHEPLAARRTAHRLEMFDEGLEVVGVVGDVLDRVVAVAFHEPGDLRRLRPVD